MNKRAMFFAAFGVAAVCMSTAASADVGVGVYLGAPAPFYAPPPVVYAPPPPVVYAPPPVYYGGYGGYGGGYRRGYWGRPHWHDHGRYRGEGRHHGRW